MLEAGLSFHKLGEVDVCIDEVVAEATGFIAACYGSKERNSMSDVRKDVWATETKGDNNARPEGSAFEQKRTMHSHSACNREASRLSSRDHQLWIQQSTAGHVMKYRDYLFLEMIVRYSGQS